MMTLPWNACNNLLLDLHEHITDGILKIKPTIIMLML